ITVYFKPEFQNTGYPYRLKADAISKALTLGGGSWSVYGLEDQGFNNDVRENAGSYRVKLSGYNYDELYSQAETLRDTLLTYKRIKEVTINSEFSYWKDDYTEFYLEIDKSRLAKDSLSVSELFGAISHELADENPVGTLSTSYGAENIKLSSAGNKRDVWAFMNVPLTVNRKMIKLSDYATIERRQTPPDIVKYNQEYIICLQYEYIGSGTQGNKMLDRIVEQFSKTLPLGYRIERGEYRWYFGDDAKHYTLLGLIALIIFFISSILFNSLRQPVAIIFVIPVSFIGVFLTFYLFDLKFDQGGFAAFILLCGITVNAAIYIINEYNSLRTAYPHIAARKLYLKAFRAKITAVFLTVLSTVLGFIPFLIGDTREGFWFPLAAGTMGGLIMSLAAIFVLLPILIIPRRETKASCAK
ncbi:MAG: efflux RND transporter permease subunit, partial [Muribaculaceae bacterium]|nr:efflux RND transporter permease subunit [Muribaculaceae bacterium]